MVNIEGFKSQEFDVTSGVPQGSVPSPLLFIIHIADINCTSLDAFGAFEVVVYNHSVNLSWLSYLNNMHTKTRAMGGGT